MHRHAPVDYVCPFCRNIDAGASDHPLEIIHRSDDVFVKMNPRWRPRNSGSVLVVPTQHHENVFDLPVELALPIHAAVRDAAMAMKAAFGCHGVSTRQHNEPAGDQDVWHYHVHVFPRYEGDELDRSTAELASEADLHRYADLLRSTWPTT